MVHLRMAAGGITSWGGRQGSGLINNCPVGQGVATLPVPRDVSSVLGVRGRPNGPKKPAGHAADRNKCTPQGSDHIGGRLIVHTSREIRPELAVAATGDAEQGLND
jgi:hypothetical protein